jgi:hypothetical protein
MNNETSFRTHPSRIGACRPWTLALFGAGLLTCPAAAFADERPTSVQTALSATTLSGYVDTSAQWNLGTGNANTPAYAFGGSGNADGFNLNVVKLSIAKPADANDGWGAGYQADLIFGPDANALATQSSGVVSDFGVRQAYVSLHAPVANGLDFKFGVWDTILGYEVTDSPRNPNFTRSYGYTIEPPTHTGLQGAYQFCEGVSAVVGVANTFGPKINQRAFPPEGPRAESYKAYMSSLALTAPKSWGFLAGSTLCGCVLNGFDSAAPGRPADQTSWYIGGTLNTPITGLKVGAAYDYAGVSAQPVTADRAAYANATALYASYQATEKLSLHARQEYASSDTTLLGARQLFATTATVQYDLWKNVLSRLEFRWDHAADGSKPFGGTVAGTPSKRNSFILLANAVYRF